MEYLQQRLKQEITHWQKERNQTMIDWYWSTPAGKIRLNRRVDFFTRAIRENPGKVLEIGCGTGMLTREITKTHHDIIAIDISPDLIRIARRQVNSNKTKFLVANAYQTKFKDNQFSCIVGISILHHLYIRFAIREFYRLLQPGGIVLFSEPNMLNPQVFLERNIPFLRRWMKNTPNETAFFKWKIRNQLQEGGFKEVQVTPFDFLHPASPSILLQILEPSTKACERIPVLREIAGSLWIKAKK